MTLDRDKMDEYFPYLTIINYLEQEYVGIVQNSDNSFLSMYVITPHFEDSDKQYFFECGETWWWTSNRSVPINIFLGQKFERFKPTLRVFVRRECEVVHGPILDLNSISSKRIKRKTITLVRNPDT